MSEKSAKKQGPSAKQAAPSDQVSPPPVEHQEGVTAPGEDAKERFREALEKKKASAHRSSESAQAGGLRGSEVMGATRRVFRRKSG